MLFSGYLWPIPDDMVKRVHESLGNSVLVQLEHGGTEIRKLQQKWRMSVDVEV
jgi:hypothetical protein